MKLDHTLAIRLLLSRAEGAMREARDLDQQIAPLAARKEATLADARALQAAADSLQADMEADAPGVEYSPADGEQPRRKHKYAVGDRVTTTSSGNYLAGEVGTIEVLQPDAERPHPSSALWYEVRFPENERGVRPLLTMSEGTLAPAPEEEQAAPGIKLLPGERLRFDIPATPDDGSV